jgi:hypothetical protein
MEIPIELILVFKVGHVPDVRKDFKPGTGDGGVHGLGFVDGVYRQRSALFSGKSDVPIVCRRF